MTELPSGTVTFLFTDIEGSTRLVKQLRDGYAQVLAKHGDLLRGAFVEHGGAVVDTQGDAFFVAFRRAQDAVAAAVAGQRALRAHTWPAGVEVRVRMGIHSGHSETSDGRYHGVAVHRAARIGAAAHGGQVLVSQTTRDLLDDEEEESAAISLRDLGEQRLKDLDRPVRLYQVAVAGLEDHFPPLRTMPPRSPSRRVRLALVVAVLAVAGGGAAAALLSTGSTSAKTVRLVANSIVVFDPKSGEAVGDVPLAFSPTDVDAGGDEVWVLNASARTATAIDPHTLKVDRTVGLDGSPDSQYATGGIDWVGFDGGVDQIDSNGVNKIPLWRPPNFQANQAPCYVFVTGDGGSVWVSQEENVAVIDASSGNVVRKLRLPAELGTRPGGTCYGLRYSDGHLLAIQSPGSSIGPVDLSYGSFTPIATDEGLTAFEYPSANWAFGFGSDWIGSFGGSPMLGPPPFLERLDPVTGQITDKIGSGISVNLAVDPASGIWASGWNHGPEDAALIRVDPKSGQITRTTLLHHYTCCPWDLVGNGVAVGHGRLWVALDSP